jgi:dTDP-4-dehydrorhamnose 3,5-epimerase
MPFEIVEEALNGLVVLRSPKFGDQRGFFIEAYRADQFAALGLPTDWVQDNHSGSTKGVLRGLHFQWQPQIAKLMRVTVGTAYLMAVDVRKGSPTLGQWFGKEVSAESALQIYAPPGFARGFCVLSDWAEIHYKCTGIYNPACEGGILWNDPELGIRWPVTDPIQSEKDKKQPTLREWLARPESDFFPYDRKK